MTVVRRLHLAHPEIAEVILLDTYDREIVVNAFRSARAACSAFPNIPFAVVQVHPPRARGSDLGQQRQMRFVVESMSQAPSLHMVNARGIRLLTPREEQVVALVAAGRAIARWLASFASASTPSRKSLRTSTSWGFRAVSNWCCTRSATAACARRNGLPSRTLETSRRQRLPIPIFCRAFSCRR